MRFAIPIGLIMVVAIAAATSKIPSDLPDASVTPGVVNPNVNQSNISKTICMSGWTKKIRPPASYTTKLKLQQLRSGPYASTLGASAFEEDHLISLELGGNPTDPKNLWPEHWSDPWGAKTKDKYENYLHKAVCSGQMTLLQARKEISTNWIQFYKTHGLK